HIRITQMLDTCPFVVQSLSLHPSCFFFLMLPPPPSSTLFPYTTLFRSSPASVSLADSGIGVPPATPSPSPTPTALREQPLTVPRSEEHTSELQSRGHLVCRLLLEKKKLPRLPLPLLTPSAFSLYSPPTS